MRDADLEWLSLFGVSPDCENAFARAVDRECHLSTKSALQLSAFGAMAASMMNPLYSRRDLLAVGNVDEQALKFWLREGLLHPVQAATGRGNHLRFNASALTTAAVLAHCRSVGLNVEALRTLTTALNDAYLFIEKHSLTPSDFEELSDARLSPLWWSEEMWRDLEDLDRKLRNPDWKSKAYQIKEAELRLSALPKRIQNAVRDLQSGTSARDSLVSSLIAEEGIVSLYRDAEDQWAVQVDSTIDNGLPSPVCVLIDLKLIAQQVKRSNVFAEADGEVA